MAEQRQSTGERTAEQLRQAIAGVNVSVDGKGVSVTARFGVASANPSQHDSRHVLVKLADEALYKAKHTGRNRVVVAQAAGVREKPLWPAQELSRVAALKSLSVLDTPPEERFDRLTRIARQVFDVRIALVSLVDENRQWFKSKVGLDVDETSREVSFCSHAILGDKTMVVPDASKDERFANNPLVVDEPHIRFYAGCPLRGPDGHRLGTLCLIDSNPRSLDHKQLEMIKLTDQQRTQ
ncbi:MAG: hypothetical protein ACI8PT_001127 [Gammaproteobacteria bacterium]|jgi:hypothetical protein